MFKTKIEFISELNRFQTSEEHKISIIKLIEQESSNIVDFLYHTQLLSGRDLGNELDQTCDKLLEIIDCVLIQ